MKYRRLMSKRPFLMFGLPFMAVIVAASFVLTPATAIRYERRDRKVRQMSREEELNVRRSARKVDMKDEYYVRVFSEEKRLVAVYYCCTNVSCPVQRLAARDLDDWEQKRVKRLPGESDGILR